MSTQSGLSGLEFLRKMAAGEIPRAPIAYTLGMGLTEVDHGAAVFRGIPTDNVANPVGRVHGGWYGTLLDSVMGCAVHSTLAAGQAYTTLEYKVNITRAIPMGTEVEARAHVQHAGRRTAVAVGEVRGVDDDRLYATGSTTCIILTAP